MLIEKNLHIILSPCMQQSKCKWVFFSCSGSQMCVFLSFSWCLTWMHLYEHCALKRDTVCGGKDSKTLPWRSKHGIFFSEHSVPLHLVKQHLRAVFILSCRVFPPFNKVVYLPLQISVVTSLSSSVKPHRWHFSAPAVNCLNLPHPLYFPAHIIHNNKRKSLHFQIFTLRLLFFVGHISEEMNLCLIPLLVFVRCCT